jgi:hypothetical protein
MSLFTSNKKASISPDSHLLRSDSIKVAEELIRQDSFFKKKRINPHTLYNTLIFIAPFFENRVEEWEHFLSMIIQENENKRPNYLSIQVWFVHTFEKALNKSEIKFLCRYVGMSSDARDRDTKLIDSMDNIELPPVNYDTWMNELLTLECDAEAGVIEVDKRSKSRSPVKRLFNRFVSVIGFHDQHKDTVSRKPHPNFLYATEKTFNSSDMDDSSIASSDIEGRGENRIRNFSVEKANVNHLTFYGD